MLESIIGSVVLEFIGAFFRWLFLSIKNRLKGNEVLSFKKVWEGRKDASFKSSIEQGMSNIGLGILILLIFLVVLTTFF